MIVLTLSFFITAVLYAAVGFGGGSTYNALLVLAETDYRILPSIALLCNLIVVSGGAYRFARAGHVDFMRIAPWVVTSVPAAWLGGYLDISEKVFVGLLGFSLIVAGVRMLWPENGQKQNSKSFIHQFSLLPPVIGAGLGILSGLVGIGGGIFLAPVLHLLHWDNAKKIAAACSVFIFVNSVAGLTGQAMKLGDADIWAGVSAYGLLFPAVLAGGQIGAYLGAKRLNPDTLRCLTAILILYVAVRLIWRWWAIGGIIHK